MSTGTQATSNTTCPSIVDTALLNIACVKNGINKLYMVMLENVTSAAASSLILAKVFERIYVNVLVSQRLKPVTSL